MFGDFLNRGKHGQLDFENIDDLEDGTPIVARYNNREFQFGIYGEGYFVFHIYGCNVQILPNATHAIQIIHQGDGTILRTESCITPAASGRHESQAPPLGKVRALNIKQTKYK